MTTIIGTQFSETLTGTAGDDVIEGRGGFDTLLGGGGNDVLRGGADGSWLDGGTGDDLVEGGAGNDHLTENDGGSDTLRGFGGDDEIIVRRFYLSKGDEKLTIEGGAGDDTIVYADYNAASAKIDAGDGDDRVSLESTSHGTVVTLGKGRDVLDLSQQQLPVADMVTVTDFQTGASGDRVEWLTALADYLIGWNQSLNPFSTGHLHFRQQGADTVLEVDADAGGTLYASHDYLVFRNTDAAGFTAFNLDGYTLDGRQPAGTALTGTTGADMLTGGGGADTLTGGDGDDTLKGGGGDDALSGGAGDDRLEDGAGTDRVDGGAGNDSIYASGGGSDIIDGGTGDDFIFLYRLNHSLNEAVTVRGGDGRDLVQLWSYAAGSVTVDAGANDDTVAIWTSSNSQKLTLGTGRDTIDLDPFYTFGMAATTRVVTDFATGSAGDRVVLQDLLTNNGWTGATNPFASGELKLVQRGADAVLQIDPTYEEGGLLDLLVFSNRTVASFTADNFDGFAPDGSTAAGRTVTGTAGNDDLQGGYGNDTIDGLNGNDTLKGLSGNDTIRGGAGDDDIDGGAGDDLLEGGDGNDSFQPTGGGSDVVRGGAGDDLLYWFRNYEGITENVTLDGGADDDRLFFQDFNPGSATIDAGAGNDVVTLLASTGPVDLTLGTGIDQLNLNGFYTGQAQGVITVRDFAPAAEHIEWTGYLGQALIRWDGQSSPIGAGFVKLTRDGADVRVTIDRDASGGDYAPATFMVLKNTALSSLTTASLDGYSPDGRDPDRSVMGTKGDDRLVGGTGNDQLAPGTGRNEIDGGAGTDTLVLSGTRASYTVLRANGQTYLAGAGQLDHVTGVEQVRFADGTVSYADAIAGAKAFDALGYIASHADLRAAFGTDAAAGARHFLEHGASEGRAVTFDALTYVASYADLRGVFGTDTAAATRHYIAYGAAEGRTASFDALAYIASYADLRAVFGTDASAGARHFIDYGAKEGRTISFDALRYVASYDDLITTFGFDTHAAERHFIEYGAKEGRAASFDPLIYGATNIDLARIFGDDPAALTRHYIEYGHAETRANVGPFDATAYLLSNSDLQSLKMGTDGALYHWLRYGADEGRSGDAAFGREQTGHALSTTASTVGAIDFQGDHDWFQFAATGGQRVEVDYHGNAQGVLELHRSDGSLVATGRAGAYAYDQILTFTADASDSYYVVVGGGVPSVTGSYNLELHLI